MGFDPNGTPDSSLMGVNAQRSRTRGTVPPSTDPDTLLTQNLRPQLVFRTDVEGRGSKLPSSDKLAGGGAPVVNAKNLKEVHSFLTSMEESYRDSLNQCVMVDKEKTSLQ